MQSLDVSNGLWIGSICSDTMVAVTIHVSIHLYLLPSCHPERNEHS